MWDWYSFEVHYVDALHHINYNISSNLTSEIANLNVSDAIMITAKACPTCGRMWQYVASDDSI